MKKKLLTMISLGTVLFAGACSNDSPDSEDEGTEDLEESTEQAEGLTAWAWDPAFNIKAIEIARDNYEEENPDFDLEIIENAQDDIVQLLNTSLSSGTDKGLPNLVLIEDYRAQTFLQTYPDAFVDLTDSFNADDFASYKIEPSTMDGKNYAIPWDSGSVGMYVRTDYLEEAGYTLDDLEDIDFDEYIEIGKDIKEETGKKLLTSDINEPTLISIMLQSGGQWFTEEDGETPNLADNEPLKAAMKTYKKLLDEDILNIHSDWPSQLEAVNDDKVASIVIGNWFTPSIAAEEEQSGDWGVAPLPTLTGIDESVHASNAGGASFYVLDIPGQEETIEFLSETFGSDVDVYSDIVNEIGGIGAYTPAIDDGVYEIEAEFFNNQQIYDDFSKWSEDIPAVNYGLHTRAIEDMLATSLQDYLDGKDLDETLEDLQKEAESRFQ